MNYLKGETVILPIAAHVKNITRSLDDVQRLAGGAINKNHVLERVVQARQSLMELEKQLKGIGQ